MNRNRNESAWWTTVFLGVLLVLWPASAMAVEFPGPVMVDIHSAVTCALSVASPEPPKEQLIVGTGSGTLRIVRTSYTETLFTVGANYLIGGRIVFLADWEGLPPDEMGFIVGAANPDQVLFIKFTHNLPYFQTIDSVDLPEDPGTLVFLGTPGQERDELAVSLPGMDRIALLRRVGGDWDVSQVLDAGDQPFSLVAMQMDGDPELEFLSANRGPLSNSLGSYDRLEDGSYDLTITHPLTVAPHQAQLYDWDQDGSEELIVAAGDSTLIQVLTISPEGVTEADHIALECFPDLLLVAPLPGSGHGVFYSATDRQIVNFYRHQEGSTEYGDAYYPGCHPVGLLSCDFNGDGIGDLVSLGGDSQNLSVMYGKPEQDFWGFPAFALSGNPGQPDLADFNGDGLLDLAVPGLGESFLDLFLGRPGGGWGIGAQRQALPFFPGVVGAIQLDGDPQSELAVYDLFASSMRMMKYSPVDGFEEVSQIALGGPVSGMVFADLDNDSQTDLLGYSQGNGDIPVFFGQGSGTFSERMEWSLGPDLGEVLTIDLNGDQLLDLVISDGISLVSYALNIGGRALGPVVSRSAGPGASQLAAGDLDGDGDQDVVVGNTEEGSLTFLENDGQGGLVVKAIEYLLPYQPEDMICADLDGNGQDEVIINLPEGGKIGVVFFYAGWEFTPLFQFPGFGDISRLLAGNFNDDQANDLLILNSVDQIGFVMPNVELVFVGVQPDALTVQCQGGETIVRISPDRSGPWILEYEDSFGRIGLAADGLALRGILDYEDGVWNLALSESDLASAGSVESGRLVLTLGEVGDSESLIVDLPLNCLDGSGTGIPPNLEWARQPWPNPFNPILKASVKLVRDGPLDADVYDLAGRLVKTLTRGHRLAGVHTLTWNGEGVDGPAPAGVYFLSIRSTDVILSRKMLLMK